MGKLKKLTHTLVVHSLVFSLLVWTVPLNNAQAEDAGLTGDNWAQAAIGITKTVGQQMVNVKQQNAAMMQQAAIMSQMQPKIVPARFFPQCQVPQAGNTPPDGVCDEVQSPMQLGGMMGYQQLAKKYDDLYTEHSSLAQNTPFPKGLQCIEESAKKTDAQMQDKLNTLTAFQNAIKKQMQAFKEQNQGLLDEMKGTNQELNGGANNSIDEKSKDVAGQFSPSCQNMLGGPGGMNNLAKGSGLLGIKNQLDTSVRGPANDFNANQAIYKKDIDNLVNKMVKKMNGDGIDNFDLTKKDLRGINPDMAARVTETFRGEVESLNKFRNQIKKDIDRTGLQFDMPEFNKDFAVDFEDFRAGAKNFYQKQYVHNCVTGADDTSLGMSAKDILGGLQQRGIRGVGNAVPRYKEALQNILSQDNHIEDKLAQIRALDAQFSGRGEITISYQDSSAKQVTTTPYKLYMDTVKSCQTQFSQDNTFSTSSKGISMKKKVDRIQGYLDRLKKKHDQFVSDAASSITDSLINCNGAEFKAGPKSCNAGTMSPKTSGFCMSHAQKCASTVNNCYNQVQKVVEKKKQVLKSKAALYNANMGALIAKQEAILKNVQASVGADSEFIKNFFPGANYTFPKDLFVAMPPMVAGNAQGNPFGVDLRGGGDLKSLETLPQKIEQLKQQLAEQKGKVQSAIKDYASKQKSAIKENQSKWKAFAAKCKGTEKAFRQQMAAADAQKQQEFAKKKGELGEFCHKFKRLKNLNSIAGCGDVDELHSDSTRIVAHLNGDVLSSLDEYKSLCATQESGDEEDEEEGEGKLLKKMCDKHSSWDRITKQLKENTKNKLPSDLNWADVEKYLDGKAELPEDQKKAAQASGFLKNLDAVRDLTNPDEIKDKFKLKDRAGYLAMLEKDPSTDEGGTKGLDDAISRVESLAGSNDHGQQATLQEAVRRLRTKKNNPERFKDTFDQYKDKINVAAGAAGSLPTSSDSCTTGSYSRTEPTDREGLAHKVWEKDKHLCMLGGLSSFGGSFSESSGYSSASVNGLPELPSGSSDPIWQAMRTEATYRTYEDNVRKTKQSLTNFQDAKSGIPASVSEMLTGGKLLNPNRRNPFNPTSQKTAFDAFNNVASAQKSHDTNITSLDRSLQDVRGKVTSGIAKLEGERRDIVKAADPLSQLKEDMAEIDTDLNDDNYVSRGIASEDNDESDDSDYKRFFADYDGDGPCDNMEMEATVKAINKCEGGNGSLNSCVEDERENYLDSFKSMSRANRVNGALMAANKDRGIASKQDWNRIGENSSDACEATATDGRSVAGIDLGEFDLATGATPLGGPGTNR